MSRAQYTRCGAQIGTLNLTKQEDTLIKFMVDDRNVEVHESGSSRNVSEGVGVELRAGTHQVDGGVMEIAGPPGVTLAVISKPKYGFTIDGAERNVTEACASYLTLLRRMVLQFEADHP